MSAIMTWKISIVVELFATSMLSRHEGTRASFDCRRFNSEICN
jgi:hypothetical protein